MLANFIRSWAWLLQDFFGIALCSLFVLTLRLPSLRVRSPRKLHKLWCLHVYLGG